MSRIFNYSKIDGINTDQMYPGKYVYQEFDVNHLFEDLDPEFIKKVESGDIVMVGKNFGCGSSREQPVVGLKKVGIKAVIAKSFARIFYRSGINQGLLLIECPEAVEAYKEGDEIEVDSKGGTIKVGKKVFQFPSLPSELQEILKDGGLSAHIIKELKK